MRSFANYKLLDSKQATDQELFTVRGLTVRGFFTAGVRGGECK